MNDIPATINIRRNVCASLIEGLRHVAPQSYKGLGADLVEIDNLRSQREYREAAPLLDGLERRIIRVTASALGHHGVTA